MKTALCQIDTVLGNIDRNLTKINHYIDKAIFDQCDLAVFPELAVTGYGLRDLVFDVGVDLDSTIFDNLKEKSKKIDILIGYVEKDSGYFYNSALYLSNGEILYNYKKNFLPDYGMFEEGRYFTQGETIETVNTQFGKITVLICEDMFHISSQNRALLNNTDILIILSASPFWMDSNSIKPTLWHSVSSNFARLSGSFVLFSNRVGFEDGVGFFGGSFIMNPGGIIIKEAELFKEELVISEFNLNDVQRAKFSMPVLKNEVFDYAY
jgi:predicted amidohydrolase